jgi:hydroxymethylbilane synthase
VKTLEALPKGSIIGTGSKRRKYQLLQLRPDFKVVDIRGNIDTRIQKMLDEPMDGIVLAAAGLNRLGIEDNEFFNSILLDVENFVPSPTQGILALQVKASNTKLLECFKGIGHKETNVQALVERDFLRALNGSCQVPIGAFCEVRGNRLKLYGLFGNEACTTVIQKSIEGTREDQEYLGKRLAEELLKEVRACQEKSI